MISGHKLVTAAVIPVCAVVGAAQATPLSTEASDNATVRPGGPRSGGSGKLFSNVEGSANGTNASYGVADFSFGTQPKAVLTVNSAQLVLTEANAAFTAAGTVVISLDASTTLANIQPGTSPLAFDGTTRARPQASRRVTSRCWGSAVGPSPSRRSRMSTTASRIRTIWC